MSRTIAAFIGHYFHKERTNSHAYFMNLLQSKFIFFPSFINSYRTFSPSIFCTPHLGVYKNIDNAIIWQVHNWIIPESLRSYDGNKFIFPMYDNDRDLSRDDYDPAANYFCFCRCLHNRLTSFGLKSLYLSFFPAIDYSSINPATPHRNTQRELKAFFWYRGDVRISLVIRLCLKMGVTSLTIKYSPDPHIRKEELEAISDIKPYGIQIDCAEWHSTHHEYLSQLSGHHVFFAPRYNEGIGFSFLEALALGLCVVAPNTPTHNEYIVHGQSGLLHDGSDFISEYTNDIDSLAANAFESAQHGAYKWRSYYAPLMMSSF